MTRRDWWLGVLLLAAALLAHAAFPRYEWTASRPELRFDRWRGRAEVVKVDFIERPAAPYRAAP